MLVFKKSLYLSLLTYLDANWLKLCPVFTCHKLKINSKQKVKTITLVKAFDQDYIDTKPLSQSTRQLI